MFCSGKWKWTTVCFRAIDLSFKVQRRYQKYVVKTITIGHTLVQSMLATSTTAEKDIVLKCTSYCLMFLTLIGNENLVN